MTKTELSFLLSAVYVYERRTDAVSPVQVDAWYQLLAGVDFGDAKTVVTSHFSESERPLSPAKILAGTRLLAQRRQPPVERTLVPDADPDDPQAFIRALKAHRYLPERNPDDFSRPALDVSSVGRQVPSGEAEAATERPRRWWRGLGRKSGE